MINLIIIFIFIFLNSVVFANEVTVIELHNQTIDQLLNANKESVTKTEILITEDDLPETEDSEKDIESELELDSNKENISQEDTIPSNKAETKAEIFTNEVSELPEMWEQVNKEDLIFLLQNINKINTSVLRNELISILDFTNSVPKDFNKEDFQKLIISSLLSLGDRKKSYQLIQTFQKTQNNDYYNYYKEFELNYLLSTYNLSKACDYRKELKDYNLISSTNFFLKVDIFCLSLHEKYDEANLLMSLLNESKTEQDEYFHYLFNKLQNIETAKKNVNTYISESNIFLYSAMHRIGNIPLTDKFLSIDPINISMPIILSNSTNIELRLKAAHLAYFNELLNIDSLAALYQTVDFTYKELNDSSNILPTLDGSIEIGMAYYYQLINIQLLPETRLEAIIEFWEFAEKNNLELIAYELSLKSLNTIEPSSEFSSFGAKILKAYTYDNDFGNAKKWLLFSENSIIDDKSLYELNSSKLLYNLFNITESDNLTNVLFENLKYMNKNLVDNSIPENKYKNEILNLIFSTLNEKIENPFQIEKKIVENRSMPSVYIINMIRSAIIKRNQPELLLAIIASINGKRWNQIHPEHFRIILLGLKEYKNGSILNDVLLEILKQSKII